MAISVEDIAKAFDAAGFDLASLTAFVAQAKAAQDVDAISAQLALLDVEAAEARADIEARRQALQADLNTKRSQVSSGVIAIKG
jgi:hypothetical protein